jgi:hypothetical protein
MDKSKHVATFAEEYEKLREGEKNLFTKVINKLLQFNYITPMKASDISDYNFLITNKEIFLHYLAIIDIDLIIDRPNQFAQIKNEEYNQFKLNKYESIVLLILRQIYQDKRDDIVLNENVEIYLELIHESLKKVGYQGGKRSSKSDILNVLRLFRNYNIIDFQNDRAMRDDFRIKIYPTILGCVNIDSLANVVEKLEKYLVPEEEDSVEDINEI